MASHTSSMKDLIAAKCDNCKEHLFFLLYDQDQDVYYFQCAACKATPAPIPQKNADPQPKPQDRYAVMRPGDESRYYNSLDKMNAQMNRRY